MNKKSAEEIEKSNFSSQIMEKQYNWSYQISFNHVLGNFIPEPNKLFFTEILVTKTVPSNSMNVLQREFSSLVVWNFHTTNTNR
jgi:hypothetical protein